jgi:hypothetical protein
MAAGLEFTTNLYLALERASNRLRSHDVGVDDRIDIAAIFAMPAFSSSTVLASINTYYVALPAHFKTFSPPTGDRDRDIFGFQAANIQATLLLLRMVFLRGDDDDDRSGPPDVQLKCNVAAELLAVFQTIPTAYLRGISTPLIYHLAGIGTILGSVMEGPLSEAGYQKAKGMLLSIADLLERLESGLSRTAHISKGLRKQVARIDEYMRAQLQSYAQPQFNHAQSLHATAVPVSQPLQHTNVEISNGTGDTDVTEANDIFADAGRELLNGWLDEFQLPPELLENWPWPFNQQPDVWSFVGPG